MEVIRNQVIVNYFPVFLRLFSLPAENNTGLRSEADTGQFTFQPYRRLRRQRLGVEGTVAGGLGDATPGAVAHRFVRQAEADVFMRGWLPYGPDCLPY